MPCRDISSSPSSVPTPGQLCLAKTLPHLQGVRAVTPGSPDLRSVLSGADAPTSPPDACVSRFPALHTRQFDPPGRTDAQQISIGGVHRPARPAHASPVSGASSVPILFWQKSGKLRTANKRNHVVGDLTRKRPIPDRRPSRSPRAPGSSAPGPRSPISQGRQSRSRPPPCRLCSTGRWRK